LKCNNKYLQHIFNIFSCRNV